MELKTSRQFGGLGVSASRRLLASHRMQRPLDAFGIARNDGEVSPCRLVRFRSALFPVPQGAERDVVACREFLLRKTQGTANDLRFGRALHSLEVGLG